MKLSQFIVSSVALSLYAASAGAGESVGTTGQPIVDGQPAAAGEIYGTVALLDSYDSQPVCTGTLIAPRVVVTAAHCVSYEGDDGQPQQTQPDQVKIAAGVLDATSAPASAIIDVEKVVPHGNYPGDEGGNDPAGVGNDYDIALLVLRQAPQGVAPVPVLAMSELDALSQGTPITITGFGLTSIAEDAPYGKLFTAQTPFERRSETEFLAGRKGDPDSCNGDSGGPAYLIRDGAVRLVGATSRAAHDSQQSCGDGGIYTLVPAYDDWLREMSDGLYPAQGSTDSGSSASAGSGAGAPDPVWPPESSQNAGPEAEGCSANGKPMSPWSWLSAAAVLGLALRTGRRRVEARR